MSDTQNTRETQRPRPSSAATGSAVWFLTGSGYDISEVTVLRHTANCVWTWNKWRNKEERSNRHSEWHHYWPTRQDAVDHLLKLARSTLARAESNASEMREIIARLEPNNQTLRTAKPES